MSPPAHDIVVQFPSGTTAPLLADRDKGHRAVMSILPDGLGPTARSATRTLWRADASTDRVTIRSASAIEPGRLGRTVSAAPLVVPAQGQEIRVNLDISCQKTPPSNVPVELRAQLKAGKAYRSRMIIVPEPERRDWARRRLEFVGLSVSNVDVSELKRADLHRRGGAIPYVTLTAAATVTDTTLLEDALLSGIGKGRSFGLGLVQFDTASSSKG